MQTRKKNERSNFSPDSLLSYASDEERAQIQELLAEIQPEPSSPATAEDDALVCKTLHSAAVALGVSPNTLDKWQNDPTFPGKRGTKGQASGHYPIGEIKRWRAATKGGPSVDKQDVVAEARRRKQQAEAALKELEFERRAGSLVDREQAESIYAATVSTARSLLEELPEVVSASLPPNKPKLRRRVAALVRRHVLRVLDALAANLDDEDSEQQPEAAE